MRNSHCQFTSTLPPKYTIVSYLSENGNTADTLRTAAAHPTSVANWRAICDLSIVVVFSHNGLWQPKAMNRVSVKLCNLSNVVAARPQGTFAAEGRKSGY